MFKKKSSPKIDANVSQSVNFEVSIADLAKRSERRAWIVAICSLVMSLILLGGYFYMLPLKEKVPYIVMADPYSGTSSLARLTDDLVNKRVTTNEAVNRSNIAHFVLARESYDLALTNMRDWPTVLTMASTDVARPYMNLHSANNETSPYKLYGKNKAIRVKILSIVLIGGGLDTVPKGATVRFQRSVYDKTSGATAVLDNKIATMEFVYKANLRMDDQSRVENPLGFQVTSYRVDSDYGSTPPVEVPVSGTPVVDPSANQTGPAAAAAPGVDPDDMPPAGSPQGAIPQQYAPGTVPGSVANESLQRSAMPASPLPADGAYPGSPSAGTPVPVPSNAVPAARSPRSAANGGRR